MPIDSSIALGVQQPNTMQTLSSMVGLKTQLQQQQLQQQAMQSNAMANQQSQIDLQETQNAQGLIKNIKNYQDPQGNIDFNKLAPDLAAAAPKNFAKFLGPLLDVQKAHTEASQSINTLDAQSRGQVGSILYSLKGQSPDAVAKTLDSLSTAYPTLAPAVSYFQKQIGPALQSGSQPAIDSALDGAGKQLVTPPDQQSMNTPSVATINDNATTKGVNVKPGVAGLPVGATVPGTTATMQLPPTAPVVNPDGSGGYLGPQGQGGPAVFELSGDRTKDLGMLNSIANDPKQPQDIRAQARAQLQQVQGAPRTSLPPGQASNMQNNVDEMNRHFGTLQDASTGNQLIQGLTGNIKSLATKAITGTESDKLAYANGLLAQFGLGHADDLKTATDLLSKNTSQLALGSPARSDAAQALIEAARPNSHMSAQAISDAADQIAAQTKTNMVVRNYLTPYKYANGGTGDAMGYQSARQQIEQTADPRIFQLEGKSPQEQQKFMQSLTPADRDSLVKKAKQLQQMGIIQ